jgi:hypothetical protein
LFGASVAPQGPYLYSSYKYVDRVVNPNFQNNLNPGPVRDLTTRWPSGFLAQRNDLLWTFYTKFFVDAGNAHLPPQYTRFETSADIRFVPTGGGAGFSYQFPDNDPLYISPGTLSYPFALSTHPYGFRAQDVIIGPGTLQWDARLLVAYTDDRVPFQLEYVPEVGVGDEVAFRAELARLGVRVRDPAPSDGAALARHLHAGRRQHRHAALRKPGPDWTGRRASNPPGPPRDGGGCRGVEHVDCDRPDAAGIRRQLVERTARGDPRVAAGALRAPGGAHAVAG